MPDLVRVDPYTRQAWAGERPLVLTLTPWRLLAALVASAGTVLTWASLAEAVTTKSRPATRPAVQRAAIRVRRELGHPAYVECVRGVGLRFNPDLAEDIYLGREAA